MENLFDDRYKESDRLAAFFCYMFVSGNLFHEHFFTVDDIKTLFSLVYATTAEVEDNVLLRRTDNLAFDAFRISFFYNSKVLDFPSSGCVGSR